MRSASKFPAHAGPTVSPELRQKLVRNPKPTGQRVAILLATKQGERFLSEQLDSFDNQIHRDWVLWVSDDASTDSTHVIVERFRKRVGSERVTVTFGPNRGAAANFLSLVCNPDIEGDYFAFSDQDDIWESDKLARALQKLHLVPAGFPALYCSRVTLVDEESRKLGLFNLWPRLPSFANALTQNIATGHTIVFNKAARNLLYQAGPVDVASHDWWCYQLISGCGGTVLYDPYPSVRYRQHDGNCLGACSSVKARVNNLKMLLNNRFRNACDKHVAALKKVEHLLTERNRTLLNDFSVARQARLVPRLTGIRACRLYRQNWHGNICLIVGALLKKI